MALGPPGKAPRPGSSGLGSNSEPAASAGGEEPEPGTCGSLGEGLGFRGWRVALGRRKGERKPSPEVGREIHGRRTDPSVVEPRKTTTAHAGLAWSGRPDLRVAPIPGDRGTVRARVAWETRPLCTRVVRHGKAGGRIPSGVANRGLPREARRRGPFRARADGGPVAGRSSDSRSANERQPSRAGSTGAPLGAAAGSRPGRRLSS
jgi:hypothetical protein